MIFLSGNRYSLWAPKLCVLWMSGILLFAAGCTPRLAPKGTRPDPASVGKILLRIAPDNLGEAGAFTGPEKLAERIAENLRTWGYSVATDDRGTGYSHVMEARVGKIERKGTPIGFSFGIGNSDPRALEFQKADVLPVDCVLRSAARLKESASMYMDFIAGGKLKDPARAQTDPAVTDTYVNHIGTVCFNLLDDLKVPRRKPAEATAGSPAWMPEVRIEVREKPAAGQPATPAAIPSLDSAPAVPSLAPVPAPASGSAPSPSEPTATRPETTETPPVQTETRTGEGRKQIIIHNQGAPVILEFGYERR